MAHPGTGRRLPAVAAAFVTAVTACVAGVAGCGASHSGAPSPGVTSSASSASSAQTATSPPSTGAAKSFCAVANPAALSQAETAGAITAPAGETLVPEAVAPDGSSFVAIEGSSVQNLDKLVLSRGHGSNLQTVSTLAAPYAGYGQMSFDGRWLVFMANQSQDITGAWDLYAWDSQGTAAPHIIASVPVATPNAPVEWPELRNGKATWVQGVADGTQQVHLYDLAAGQDKVVHTGHIGASVLAGDLLVWTEALHENGPVTLAAVSISTGAPASLPGPVAQVQTSPATLASDGTTWAWTSADYLTLYAWRAGMPAAVTVHTTAEGNPMDSVGVAGDVVTWTDSTATFAADVKTGSFTQVTKQYGSALTNGGAIMVYYPLGDVKSPSLKYDVFLLKTSDLAGLATC